MASSAFTSRLPPSQLPSEVLARHKLVNSLEDLGRLGFQAGLTKSGSGLKKGTLARDMWEIGWMDAQLDAHPMRYLSGTKK